MMRCAVQKMSSAGSRPAHRVVGLLIPDDALPMTAYAMTKATNRASSAPMNTTNPTISILDSSKGVAALKDRDRSQESVIVRVRTLSAANSHQIAISERANSVTELSVIAASAKPKSSAARNTKQSDKKEAATWDALSRDIPLETM